MSFAYIHTDTSVSMLEIRVSIRVMCSSALWHKFRVFFHCSLPLKGIWIRFLKNGTSFVFTFPSKTAYLVCPVHLFHFSSSKHNYNRLLYSPVSHETYKNAKLRSVLISNHVLQIQLCRIRFYFESTQYLLSFVFFSIFITFVYVSYTRFTKHATGV